MITLESTESTCLCFLHYKPEAWTNDSCMGWCSVPIPLASYQSAICFNGTFYYWVHKIQGLFTLHLQNNRLILTSITEGIHRPFSLEAYAMDLISYRSYAISFGARNIRKFTFWQPTMFLPRGSHIFQHGCQPSNCRKLTKFPCSVCLWPGYFCFAGIPLEKRHWSFILD